MLRLVVIGIAAPGGDRVGAITGTDIANPVVTVNVQINNQVITPVRYTLEGIIVLAIAPIGFAKTFHHDTVGIRWNTGEIVVPGVIGIIVQGDNGRAAI